MGTKKWFRAENGFNSTRHVHADTFQYTSWAQRRTAWALLMSDGREGRVACAGVTVTAGGLMKGLGEYVGTLVARIDWRESEGGDTAA